MDALLASLNLDPQERERCLGEAARSGLPLEQVLFEAGHLDEEGYLYRSGQRYGMPVVPDLAAQTGEGGTWTVDPEQVRALPLSWLRRRQVLPLRDRRGRIGLAAARPSGWLYAQEAGLLTGEHPTFCLLAPEAALSRIVNTIYGEDDGREDSVARMLDGAEGVVLAEEAVEDLLEESSDAPFIRTVNTILAQALRAGASDIHIEPYRDFSRVRFRLDGVLYERHTLNKAHHAAVVSRIKVMAKLDIAEKRLPQDGRIAIVLGGRQAGLRVSTLPTSFGERVVLRLLEKNERILSLSELGLGAEDFSRLGHLISSMHGMVLVTGPTGSGKTTSLYAMLQEIASPDKNILTIEDPVEYELDGVGQMQVNPRINLTFANGLRALVRQDPDVVLIGEIRDGETASIAVQSALTGHLVFSTLHTNDAPGAVIRLFDMGVEPFLLASVLRGVVAQRLVRVLCPDCRQPVPPDTAMPTRLAEAGLPPETEVRPCRPVGCDRCMGTGYRGRMAIYEIMTVDETLGRMMIQRTDAAVLRQQAEARGMRSLYRDGLAKVLQGLTSLEEVERVVRA